ncbi:MAG: histidine--tRNA ligase [Acidobacteria bacterium RIFCSPLOWO2_12_FULL_66_21]|nr:MAG: histidine--tRNA ligase [Acidobacteria bacterium RIFCSPLOWO2_12_FULL_66_21]
MASQQTRPARGMRDFLPEDVRRRDYVIGVVAAVYQRYGFEPLETPALENIETLTGKYGEEGNKLIFKVLRRGEHESSGETDLALRYDLTVPLARVVAEYRGKLPRFFKRYQIQAVWRADRPARGRFREFYQCDVDAIGSKSMVVEAELCAAVSDVLLALGFAAFDIKVNHRAVLTGLLSATGIPLPFHGTALVAIDKLDKIGRDGVRRELVERGIGEPAADAALDIFKDGVTIEQVRGALTGRVEALAGLDDVRQIFELSQATAAGAHLRFDPSLARGLSYYTGAIMEIAVADLPGSLGGGGRYDGLIGMFSGEDVPACGFSLGLERILVVMAERGMFPADVQKPSADVLVALFDEQTVTGALRLAGELRAAGLRVEVYPEPDKLGKQMKYAAGKGIPFAAILGGDEIAAGQVTIKNLGTGEQVTLDRAAAASHVLERRAPSARLRASGASARQAESRAPSPGEEP